MSVVFQPALATDTLISSTDVALSTWNSAWTVAPNSVIDATATGARILSSSTAARPMAIYGGGITWPADQWVAFTIGGMFAGSTMGAMLRASTASGGSGYSLTVLPGPAGNITLVTFVNGAVSGSSLYAVTPSPGVAVGDTFRLSIVNDLLTLEWNGTVLYKGQNTVITAAGAVGIAGTGASAGGSTSIHDFSAGGATYAIDEPGFLLIPRNITPGGTTTANTWRTGINAGRDLITGGNGVPADATGVVLNWYATNATTFAARKNGTGVSPPTPVPNSAQVASGANNQGFYCTGIEWVGTPTPLPTFDFFMSAPAGLVIFNVGYFGPETTFFDEPIPVTLPTLVSGTPAMLDISAQCPGAVAVIADLWGNNCRIVPHGDADFTNHHFLGWSAQSVICGVAGGRIDIAMTGTSQPSALYLRGYMRSGFVWRTPPVDVSPTAAGTGQVIPVTGPYQAPPTGFLYQVTQAQLFGLWGRYSNPATYNPQKYPLNNSGQVYAGPGPGSPRVNPAGLPLEVYEQGYFIQGGVTPSGPPTTIRSYFAIRTTEQS